MKNRNCCALALACCGMVTLLSPSSCEAQWYGSGKNLALADWAGVMRANVSGEIAQIEYSPGETSLLPFYIFGNTFTDQIGTYVWNGSWYVGPSGNKFVTNLAFGLPTDPNGTHTYFGSFSAEPQEDKLEVVFVPPDDCDQPADTIRVRAGAQEKSVQLGSLASGQGQVSVIFDDSSGSLAGSIVEVAIGRRVIAKTNAPEEFSAVPERIDFGKLPGSCDPECGECGASYCVPGKITFSLSGN